MTEELPDILFPEETLPDELFPAELVTSAEPTPLQHSHQSEELLLEWAEYRRLKIWIAPHATENDVRHMVDQLTFERETPADHETMMLARRRKFFGRDI